MHVSTQSSRKPLLSEQIQSLEQRGITTREEQARALGVHRRTLQKQLSSAGLADKPNHSEWIPWTVKVQHHNAAVNKRLRLLAMSAEGRDPKNRADRGKAVQWALRLVESDLDVTYDPEIGWGTKPADPTDWYIRRLVKAAIDHVLRDMRSDLEEDGEA
jgi:hypothetical protein